jgi:hypothetical protein
MNEAVATAAPTRAVAFDLLAELREDIEGRPILSPAKFIDLMSLDVSTFASHAHVHRNTVSRAPASLGVQQHLQVTVRVLRAALDVFKDVQNAIYWFKNEPLPPFDYKTPQTLVTEGRADDVIRLLDSYSAGFTG